MIDPNSLKRITPLIILFLLANYTISPSGAEIEPLVEKEAFLTAQPRIKKVFKATITGYSSSYDETDHDPWLTAYNTLARDGVAASNVLKYGTKIRIPSLFGDKIFVIEDRMNERFDGENIDIWFESKEKAKKFGIHRDVLVEILE
ncbi:MAG: 3D domain-containing protein [Patescibacteria group bacterium]|nr:3D domain-containing protein [Patescibacteria group bacterium]